MPLIEWMISIVFGGSKFFGDVQGQSVQGFQVQYLKDVNLFNLILSMWVLNVKLKYLIEFDGSRTSWAAIRSQVLQPFKHDISSSETSV